MSYEHSHLRPVTEAIDPVHAEEPWDGVTPPRSRHAGPRFLTDVIVELGLVPPEPVQRAVEQARTTGTTP
jgi:hypothetical protein